MEIVCDNVQEKNTADNLPGDISAKLKTLQTRMECELAYTSQLVQTLDTFELTHQKISGQVVKCWLQGISPTKLQAVLSFLLEHHASVVRGDTPLPLDSPFRKIPFSK